jgi:hypothetical protein
MRQVLAQRLAIVSGLAVSLAAVTSADHSWGNYHWARSTSSFTLQSGNNVDSRWEDYLDEAINDWNRSAALDS